MFSTIADCTERHTRAYILHFDFRVTSSHYIGWQNKGIDCGSRIARRIMTAKQSFIHSLEAMSSDLSSVSFHFAYLSIKIARAGITVNNKMNSLCAFHRIVMIFNYFLPFLKFACNVWTLNKVGLPLESYHRYFKTKAFKIFQIENVEIIFFSSGIVIPLRNGSFFFFRSSLFSHSIYLAPSPSPCSDYGTEDLLRGNVRLRRFRHTKAKIRTRPHRASMQPHPCDRPRQRKSLDDQGFIRSVPFSIYGKLFTLTAKRGLLSVVLKDCFQTREASRDFLQSLLRILHIVV